MSKINRRNMLYPRKCIEDLFKGSCNRSIFEIHQNRSTIIISMIKNILKILKKLRNITRNRFILLILLYFDRTRYCSLIPIQ